MSNHFTKPEVTRDQRGSRFTSRYAILGMLVVGAVSAAMTWGIEPRTVPAAARESSAIATPPSRVAARGRIEPSGGIVRLAAPAARQPAVVAELRVAEGDWVEAGQIVAVLDGVAGLKATTQRLDAVLRHAEAERRRFDSLCPSGIASLAECDVVRLRLDTARADLTRARADLDASYVRAPQAGRILAVHTTSGERVEAHGIVEMGDTRTIDVVAEIYETDAPRLRRGQIARIHAASLGEPLTGSVERIGAMVGKQQVFGLDPAADADARVVETRIRLADSDSVAMFTNLQVDVVIEIAPHAVPSDV